MPDFAECCLLALLGIASYPVLVHRLAASLHASSPHSVTLMQLRFASFAVANLREDFHLQDRAHAGRTTKNPQSHGPCGFRIVLMVGGTGIEPVTPAV